MIYGYARVSTDGQSVESQIGGLTVAGAVKVFHEVARGAKTGRAQLRRLLDALTTGDVVTVTRLNRPVRSTVAHPESHYGQGVPAGAMLWMIKINPTAVRQALNHDVETGR